MKIQSLGSLLSDVALPPEELEIAGIPVWAIVAGVVVVGAAVALILRALRRKGKRDEDEHPGA